MKKYFLLSLCFFILGTTLTLAQDKEKPAKSFWKSEGETSKSILTGGFVIGESLLLVSKLGYEYKHLGVLLDFTNDHAWQKRAVDNSKDGYHLYATSVAGRYYTKPQGRSLFAEAGAGLGKAYLNTERANGQIIQKRAVVPLAAWGLGWRFGRKPRGLFGEVSYRINYALKNSHLYTDAIKPEVNEDETLSYHSWYFKKGKALPQLFLGIGYSF